MELTDVGTRYEHYRELIDLWEQSLSIIDDFQHSTLKSKEKKAQLTAAVAIMNKQLDVLSDYEGRRYYTGRQIEAAYNEVPLGEGNGSSEQHSNQTR